MSPKPFAKHAVAENIPSRVLVWQLLLLTSTIQKALWDVSHLEHGSLRFSQLIKRRLSGRHLDDGATQGPDVRRLAVPSGTLVDDFRSHVLQRACTNRHNPLHTRQLIIHKNVEMQIQCLLCPIFTTVGDELKKGSYRVFDSFPTYANFSINNLQL